MPSLRRFFGGRRRRCRKNPAMIPIVEERRGGSRNTRRRAFLAVAGRRRPPCVRVVHRYAHVRTVPVPYVGGRPRCRRGGPGLVLARSARRGAPRMKRCRRGGGAAAASPPRALAGSFPAPPARRFGQPRLANSQSPGSFFEPSFAAPKTLAPFFPLFFGILGRCAADALPGQA